MLIILDVLGHPRRLRHMFVPSNLFSVLLDQVMEIWRMYVCYFLENFSSSSIHFLRLFKGSLRCDINVSLNRLGMPTGSGTRCEIKNLNSVKFITAAISMSFSSFFPFLRH